MNTGELAKVKAGAKIEALLERLVFASRWLMAPFYVGLIGALLMLLGKFVEEFVTMMSRFPDLKDSEMIVAALSLVDMSLAGNLLLMVIFAGYENFVSKIHTDNHEDRPEWMGKVDFSGLKIKLVASIVAISAIQLLKAFIDVRSQTQTELAWMVGIHVTFVVSGVLLALMDRLALPKAHAK